MKGPSILPIAVLVLALYVLSRKKEAPAPTTSPASRGNIPAGFTGTGAQLETLGLPPTDPVYQEKVDLAYAAVAATVQPGQLVAWSSERGYYAIDEDYVSQHPEVYGSW